MKILDRYLLRRFNITLSFALLSFIFVVVFVDMVGNLGSFIDKDVPKLIIFKYYVLYVPYILVLVLPIAMLLASLFSMGQMAKYNELLAIKAVGISLYRIILPLLLFGFFVSLLALGFGEKVVPATNQEKTQIEADYLEPSKKIIKTTTTNIYWKDKEDRRIFIGRYDNNSKTAHKVTIQKYDGSEISERIDARTMKWQDGTWVLYNGFKRSFSHGEENATKFETLRDNRLDVTPQKLLQSQIEPEDMSYEELKNFTHEIIRNGGDPRKWLVDMQFKISIPFASFIMVLFGAPLASQKKASGAILSLIISFLVSLIYYGFSQFMQTLGELGVLSPFITAWLPNMLFLFGGILLIIFVRK